MPNLQAQPRFINVIVNRDYYPSDIESRLDNYLSTLGLYAWIKHDNDINEDGSTKRVHYHIVILRDKKIRLITQLNQISKLLGYDDNNGIEIESCVSIEGAIQYLIHKNDSLKFQYDIGFIHTNMDDDELKAYMTAEIDNLSVSYILQCITINNGRLSAIIDTIGLKRYKNNRNVIMDIYKEWYRETYKYDYK